MYSKAAKSRGSGGRSPSPTANTSANATVPQAVKDGKRSVVEIGQLTINDGGLDGVTATAPNGVFARQGIFIP